MKPRGNVMDEYNASRIGQQVNWLIRPDCKVRGKCVGAYYSPRACWVWLIEPTTGEGNAGVTDKYLEWL